MSVDDGSDFNPETVPRHRKSHIRQSEKIVLSAVFVVLPFFITRGKTPGNKEEWSDGPACVIMVCSAGGDERKKPLTHLETC